MGKKNSLEIDVKIKDECLSVVEKALNSYSDPQLAPIKNFLSHATIDSAGCLAFKPSKNDSEDPYCTCPDDGTTIALYGKWDEHEKIACWIKQYSEKGGKIVLYSCDGDGLAWGWEFDGKGKMRELRFRYIKE
jgi:hypothetical protein